MDFYKIKFIFFLLSTKMLTFYFTFLVLNVHIFSYFFLAFQFSLVNEIFPSLLKPIGFTIYLSKTKISLLVFCYMKSFL